jgi:hypothetical protein
MSVFELVKQGYLCISVYEPHTKQLYKLMNQEKEGKKKLVKEIAWYVGYCIYI